LNGENTARKDARGGRKARIHNKEAGDAEKKHDDH